MFRYQTEKLKKRSSSPNGLLDKTQDYQLNFNFL